jgi:hypothetical protein
VCSRVVILDRGRVVASGTVAEIAAAARLARAGAAWRVPGPPGSRRRGGLVPAVRYVRDGVAPGHRAAGPPRVDAPGRGRPAADPADGRSAGAADGRGQPTAVSGRTRWVPETGGPGLPDLTGAVVGLGRPAWQAVAPTPASAARGDRRARGTASDPSRRTTR